MAAVMETRDRTVSGYRLRYFDPDYRRAPKTPHYCAACQKDLKRGAPFRAIHVVGGGMEALHPDDEAAHKAAHPDGDPGDLNFFPIGSDCARRLGLEWTWPPATIEESST